MVNKSKSAILPCLIDACENIKCGQNAECVSARHSGQCKCKEGYVGNGVTEKGCRLREVACTSKSDCSDDQYCHKGICQGNRKVTFLEYFKINKTICHLLCIYLIIIFRTLYYWRRVRIKWEML